jgi:chemotaxis protein methyltransferase CheR
VHIGQGAAIVSDIDCVTFLQWALPRLDMRWAGFRKVRGQVCKRVKRRIRDLGLDGFTAYRTRLEAEPQEWRVLDEYCRITISRFFRDRGVFEALRRRVLPDIAVRASQEEREARGWSAGCASGEEPYSLRIIWDIEVASRQPDADLSITATDIDQAMLERAREGCFEAASLRESPPHLVAQAFDRIGDRFCVRARHRAHLDFLQQDIRSVAPRGQFDLVLCRNLAFTYFAPALQTRVLTLFLEHILPMGYLVIGTHEQLPRQVPELAPLEGAPQIFQRLIS